MTIEAFRLIAHRGHPTKQEENSKLSFEHALEAGATCIEFDVQMTKDSIPVVFHDECLHRLCSDSRIISQCNWNDLPPTTMGNAILSLNDFLEFIKMSDCDLHMEIKNPDAIQSCLDLISKHNISDKTTISSFHHGTIEVSKILCPSIKTMALFEGQTDRTRIRHIIAKTKCDALGMDFPSWSAHKHQFPIPTYLYTVNTISDIQLARQHGISGVYTDNINLQLSLQ